MDATKLLGGSNYVLWVRREGYETLLNGSMTLKQIAASAAAKALNPTPRSGRQEKLENLVTRNL